MSPLRIISYLIIQNEKFGGKPLTPPEKSDNLFSKYLPRATHISENEDIYDIRSWK